MQKKTVGMGIVVGAIAMLAGSGAYASQDSTNLTLDINDYAAVNATTSLTVTPTLADIMSNQVVEQDGIQLGIDSTSGAVVTWQGSGGDGTGGTIDDDDITLSSNGSTFVPGDGETALYTSSSAQSSASVPIDVKISNLQNYSIGQHTNTLTFTVVAN
jgi:hypothetical protein